MVQLFCVSVGKAMECVLVSHIKTINSTFKHVVDDQRNGFESNSKHSECIVARQRQTSAMKYCLKCCNKWLTFVMRPHPLLLHDMSTQHQSSASGTPTNVDKGLHSWDAQIRYCAPIGPMYYLKTPKVAGVKLTGNQTLRT